MKKKPGAYAVVLLELCSEGVGKGYKNRLRRGSSTSFVPTIGRGRCVLRIGEIFEALGQDLFLNRQDAVLFRGMNIKLENTK